VVYWLLFGCYMGGATWNCCRLGASSVYTIQSCTSLQCHVIQNHIGRVHVCLAVTCHLRFWQNDRDFLRASAVTWGYRNKSQHRKLTLDAMEKKILPPLLRGLEPGTVRSRVWRSNHWAILAPALKQQQNHNTPPHVISFSESIFFFLELRKHNLCSEYLLTEGANMYAMYTYMLCILLCLSLSVCLSVKVNMVFDIEFIFCFWIVWPSAGCKKQQQKRYCIDYYLFHYPRK